MGLKSYLQQFDRVDGFKIFSMIFIITSAVFLFWRAKFGFGFNDEAFVVTLGERLFDGDALFYDEWHLSQNFGVVVLPFFAFTKLFGVSNDGILLMLRYCSCVLWLATCLCVYFTLNKKYKSSILAYAYLIFFAPFDIMSVSYNSIGIMAVLLLCCVMYRIKSDEKCPILYKFYFSLLWIVIVFCSPLMAIVYVITFIASVVCARFQKGYMENLRSCYIFSGVVVAVTIAIYFFTFIYSRANMNHILEGLEYIISDPEHEGSVNLVNFLREIYYMLHKNHLVVISVAVACIVGMLKKYKNKLRLPIFAVCSVIFVILQLVYMAEVAFNPNQRIFNYYMLNISLLGFAAFMLLENKPWKLFGVFYGMGILYAIVGNLSSNTGTMVISTAMTVGGVCGIICIVHFCRELSLQYSDVKFAKIAANAVLFLVVMTQFTSTIHTRFARSFWDDGVSNLTEKIEFGSSKGIYTTPENLAEYESVIGNLKYLLSQTDTKGKTFMSCTFYPSIYLDANLEIETFSVWTHGFDNESLNERILQYQKLHDGVRPDLVYCYEEKDILPLLSEGYDSIEYNGSYLFILKE